MRLKIGPRACFWQMESGRRLWHFSGQGCWRIKTAVEFNRRSLVSHALAFSNIHKTQFWMFFSVMLEEKWRAE